MTIFTHRQFRLPRTWSNKELKKLAPFFSGDIVNVSGWDDRDKQGGRYKDYFEKAASYSITNYKGTRGLTGSENEIFLDLSKDLPEELNGKFDVVFNHTTLEHIYDFRKALASICSLSSDIVFIIVPFAQALHESEDFEDFWRFSPSGMKRLFEDNGLSVVYESASPDKNAGIYLLFIASKQPEKWKRVIPPSMPVKKLGDWIGWSFIPHAIRAIKRRLGYDR